MKNADGELSGREGQEKGKVVPQAIQEKQAIQEARQKALDARIEDADSK